jgi:hypothetical protein
VDGQQVEAESCPGTGDFCDVAEPGTRGEHCDCAPERSDRVNQPDEGSDTACIQERHFRRVDVKADATSIDRIVEPES